MLLVLMQKVNPKRIIIFLMNKGTLPKRVPDTFAFKILLIKI